MSTVGNDSAPMGQGEIGAEHQRMAELIQALGALIRDRRSRDAILAAAHDLASFSDLHFGHEKELMAATDYPATNAHLWEHRMLLDKLAMLIHSLEYSEAGVSTYVIDFIDRWFIDHVQGSDAELGAYLAGREGTTG